MHLIFKNLKKDVKRTCVGTPITKIIYKDKSSGVEFQQVIKKEHLTAGEIKRDEKEKKNLLGSGIEIKEIEKGLTVF